jgi:hypothetical protein
VETDEWLGFVFRPVHESVCFRAVRKKDGWVTPTELLPFPDHNLMGPVVPVPNGLFVSDSRVVMLISLAPEVDRIPSKTDGAAPGLQTECRWGGARGRKQAQDFESPPDLPCRAAFSRPNVDGDLRDWSDGGWTSLDSPAYWQPDFSATTDRQAWGGDWDMSAEVQSVRDAGFLYLAVRVRDDVHAPATRGFLWTGDSWHVAFAPEAGAFHGDEALCTQWVFSLRDGVTVADAGYRLRSVPEVINSLLPTGLIPQGGGGEFGDRIRAAGVRSEVERVTRYEIAIPWARLPATRPMRWDFAVNDSDGNGREGHLEWASGLYTLESTYGFGQLDLIEEENHQASNGG